MVGKQQGQVRVNAVDSRYGVWPDGAEVVCLVNVRVCVLQVVDTNQ